MSGTHRVTPERPPRRPLRRSLDVTRAILFNLVAVLGAVSIALVVLALVFHISLVLFRSGSMSPTIPTGSLAVVKRIPAAHAKIGDIVTVDRPNGQLPVTHRVVSTTPGPDGTTSLVLKGDANRLPDSSPYRVKTVRLVIWHVARLARVVVWFSQPLVLGGLTLLVAGLVVWTLWPKRDDSADGDPEAADDDRERVDSR
jgi:signal peptidase I